MASKRPFLRRSGAKKLVSIAAAASAALSGVVSPISRAADTNAISSYTGGGTTIAPVSGNWNTATHWSPVGIPASSVSSVSDTELDFGGSGSTAYTSTNDVPSPPFSLNQIQLSSTASVAETITGSGLNFGTATTGNLFAPSIAQNGTGAFTISNSISLANPLAVTGAGTGSLTFTGGISDNGGGFTVAGAGTTVLGVVQNTYTGQTTVGNTATLSLDFTQTSGAAGTNIVNSTSPLALGGAVNPAGNIVGGGGTLLLKGKASATNSQTFANTTINAGASSIVANSGSGGSLSLALGAITRNPGGTVDFTLPSSGSITTTTSNYGGQTTLGGYATVGGTSWAVSTGDGSTPYTIAALPSASYSTSFTSPGDIDSQASASVAATTINSLRFNTPNSQTITFTGPVQIVTGGILETSNVGANAITIAGSIVASDNPQDIVFIQNNVSGALTVTSQIGGFGALTKAGPGTLVLNNNTNMFQGAVYVDAGTLSVISGSTGGNSSLGLRTSGIYVYNGATLVAGAQDAFGYSAGNGATVININGGTVTDLATSNYRVTMPNISFTGGSLLVAGTSATSGNIGDANNCAYSFQYGGITSNAATTTAVMGGSNGFTGATFGTQAALTFTVAAGSVTSGPTPGVDLLVSGSIVPYGGNAFGIDKEGPGVLELSGANTFNGSTTINGGELRLGANNTLPTAQPVILGNAAGAVLNVNGFSQSIAGLSGGGTSGGNVNIGAGALTLTGGTNAFAGNVNVGTGAFKVTGGTNTFSGAVTVSGSGGGLNLTGGTNTFSGAVALSPGTLYLSAAGNNSFTGGLTTSTGSAIGLDETAPWSSPANTGALLSVNGTLTIAPGTFLVPNLLSSSPNGDYRLIQYTGTAPTLSNFTLSPPRNETYTLVLGPSVGDAAGYIDLVVGTSTNTTPITGNWLPTAAGSFNWVSGPNWSSNPLFPSGSGDTANFQTALAGSQTVLLNGQQHVGTLTLNPTGGAGAYTIAPNVASDTLFLDNLAKSLPATITNSAGNNVISAQVSLLSNTNVTVTGATTLALNGAVGGTGSLTSR